MYGGSSSRSLTVPVVHVQPLLANAMQMDMADPSVESTLSKSAKGKRRPPPPPPLQHFLHQEIRDRQQTQMQTQPGHGTTLNVYGDAVAYTTSVQSPAYDGNPFSDAERVHCRRT